MAALQAAVLLVVAGVAFGLGGAPHDVMALLGGGSASVLNGALLAWRMSGTAPAPARKSDGFHNAQRELRRMYFFAAERFVAIIACLGVCLAVLKLPPLAVLVGFVAGQVVLLAARLFLNRLFKSNKDKNQ